MLKTIVNSILLPVTLVYLFTFNTTSAREIKVLKTKVEKLEKFSVLKFQLCEDKDETKCEKYRAYDIQYDEPTEEGLMTYRIRYINEKHLEQFLDTIRSYLVELEEDKERREKEQWEQDFQQQETARETRAE